MYQITLQNNKQVTLTDEQFQVLRDNWHKPEVFSKVQQIKDWEFINQPQLSGFEYAKSVAARLRTNRDADPNQATHKR